MNALTVLKIIGALHSHFGPGRSPRYYHLMKSTDKTMVTVGPNTWRANVRAFFEFLDQAFGVKTIKYADLSAHIRFGFLRTLAQVFADHKSFWIDTKLTIDPRDFQKMRAFPINDPGVVALIGGSSSVNPILYQKIVAHLNSGRRTTRMVKWNGQAADGIVSMDIDQGGGDDDSDTGPDSTMGEVEFATQ